MPPPRPAPDPGIVVLDLEGDGGPIVERLAGAVRRAVLDGRFRPGQRLPATRALATDLGVARGTVVEAYDRLRVEGYLVSRVGAGTHVAELPPDLLARTPSSPVLTNAEPLPVEEPWAAGGPDLTVAAVRPFQPGLPPLDLLPRGTLARLFSDAVRSLPTDALGAGDPAGYRPLRAALADHLAVTRGVRCTADHVVITAGSQQALHLAARVLGGPGRSAWFEDPGYPGARVALEAAGVSLVPVPVDADGLVVTEGVVRAPDASLAFVTPSHQYPLGVTMSLGRRLELLDWARSSGAWVIEDDYEGELRLTGPPLPSLQSLDGGRRVVYVGSFSKTVSPALRVGYAVVPGPLVPAFVRAKAETDIHGPIVTQAVLAEFVGGGHLGRHLRRVRAESARRQRAVVDAVGEALEGRVRIEPAEGGLHVVAHLPDDVDDRAVSDRAAEAGVTVPALSAHAHGDQGPRGLLLGYAAFDGRAVRDGVRRLASVVRWVWGPAAGR